MKKIIITLVILLFASGVFPLSKNILVLPIVHKAGINEKLVQLVANKLISELKKDGSFNISENPLPNNTIDKVNISVFNLSNWNEMFKDIPVDYVLYSEISFEKSDEASLKIIIYSKKGKIRIDYTRSCTGITDDFEIADSLSIVTADYIKENLIIAKENIKSKTPAGLYRAIVENDIEEARTFLESGISPNAPYDSRYPVFEVLQNEKMPGDDKNAFINLLQEFKADFNVKNNSGLTPLNLLIKNDINIADKTRIMSLLLNAGADPNIPGEDGDKLIFKLINNYDKRPESEVSSMIKMILEHGANINIFDKYGYTPLMLAVRNLDTNLVSMLIKKGAEINRQNDDGSTALMFALSDNRKKRIEMMELLIDNGADVNLADRQGITVLMDAASDDKNIDVVKFLVSKNADINIGNEDGLTALHNAQGCKKTYEFLKSKGGKLYSFKYPEENDSPLCLAVIKKDLKGDPPISSMASS